MFLETIIFLVASKLFHYLLMLQCAHTRPRFSPVWNGKRYIIKTLQNDEETLFTCAFLKFKYNAFSSAYTPWNHALYVPQSHRNDDDDEKKERTQVLFCHSADDITYSPFETNIHFSPVEIYLSCLIQVCTNQYKHSNVYLCVCARNTERGKKSMSGKTAQKKNEK